MIGSDTFQKCHAECRAKGVFIYTQNETYKKIPKARDKTKWRGGSKSRDVEEEEEDIMWLLERQALGAKGSRGSRWFQDSDSGDLRESGVFARMADMIEDLVERENGRVKRNRAQDRWVCSLGLVKQEMST